MKIFQNRKGIFYTIISIALLGLLIFGYLGEYQYSKNQLASVIETRVLTMNNFLKNIDVDIKKGVHISGYRALIGLENQISSTGTYIDDLQLRFSELFVNGTYNSEEIYIMVNNTFINWTQKMVSEALKIDIIINFSIEGVSVYQTDPWNVEVAVNLTMNLNDSKGTASWEMDQVISEKISIEEFDDPLYTIYTNNNVVKPVRQTIYENDYVTGTDVSNLQDHMDQTYYAEFTGAPSFLMRFEGNLSADPDGNGIESLVDKDEVGVWTPRSEGTSSVDYLYWDSSSATTDQIQGMPNSFRMDEETDLGGNFTHVDKYEVEGLKI